MSDRRFWANGFADGEPYEHPDRALARALARARTRTRLVGQSFRSDPLPPFFPVLR